MKVLDIQALSHNGFAPITPLSGTVFHDTTIGRNDDNIIVLPDPGLLVSRRHLKFSFDTADGTYHVRNISSKNPVFVNDVELGPGMEYAMKDGDQIFIGGYVLQVRYATRQDAQIPKTSPVPRSGTNRDDFISELLGPDAVTRLPAQQDASTPDDGIIDTFVHGTTVRRDPMQMLDEHGIELDSLDNSGNELIDGGGSRATVNELLKDPLSTPAGRQIQQEENDLDPLAMFNDDDGGPFGDILQSGKNTKASPVPHMDLTHGPELGSLFHLPGSGRDASTAPQTTPDAESPTELPAELWAFFDAAGVPGTDAAEMVSGQGMEESFPGLGDIDAFFADLEKSSAAPKAGIPQSPAADPPPAAPPPVRPPAAPPPRPSVAPSAIPSTAGSAPAPGAEELYQAFVEGLGMDLPGRVGLDKVFMNMLGQMLRNYTQGTLELLTGRTIIKKEVKANVTVIAPDRNNPLKFAPNIKTALPGLLGKPLPGFMGPGEAVRDAFVDLRAHQIGIFSGMKATLEHVLERFDPASFSANNPPNGLIENTLPVSRKARLWDEYAQFFRADRERANDHLEKFFNAAFLRAYEEAIFMVQSGERKGRS